MLTAALLPLLLAPLRARVLGPAGRGEFSYFQAALAIVMATAGSGIRHAYYSQEMTGPRRAALWTKKLWLPSLCLGLAMGVPLALFGFLSLGPVIGIAVLIMSCGAPGYAFVQMESGDAQRRQSQLRIAGITSTPACFEFVANIVMLVTRSLTVTTAVLATILSETSRGVVAYCFRRADRVPGNRPVDLHASARFAGDALRYMPATLVPLLAANVDSIVYGAFGHASSLGIYSVAKLAPSFLVLTASITEGRFVASAARIGVRRSVLTFGVMLTGLAAIIAGGGAVVVRPLFGAAFADAVPAFALTAALGTAGSLYVWLVAACAARGRGRLSIWSSTAVLVVSLLGSIAIAVTPAPSPAVLGIPVLGGYTTGCLLLVCGLRGGRRGR